MMIMAYDKFCAITRRFDIYSKKMNTFVTPKGILNLTPFTCLGNLMNSQKEMCVLYEKKIQFT